ncbi:MAG: B-box zinc finger protein [Myxococcota bacterium]|nr:B-box zinc finger protein [Myxococcota bacterium]
MVVSQDWEGLYCPDHPGHLSTEPCTQCGRPVCSECQRQSGGRALCPEHASHQWEARARVRVRQLVMLAAFAIFLFGVAEAWRWDRRQVETGRPVRVGVFQFAPPEARFHPLLRSLNGLEAPQDQGPSLLDLEDWFSEEKARYGRSGRAVELQLHTPWFDGAQPPSLGEPDDGPLRLVARSLGYVRWFKTQLRARGERPSDYPVKLYVVYVGADGDIASHSRGSKKGRMAVAHISLHEQNPTYALITLGHELCHALGASDKYDPGSYLPAYPQGYVEPFAEPLYPQRFAEIMAVDRPLSLDLEAEPTRLEEMRVGHLTAAEMGWISQRQAEWFYVPEEQADALARLPDLP